MKLRSWHVIAAGAALFAAIVAYRYWPQAPVTAPSNARAVEATPAAPIRHAERVTITPPKMRVYKPGVKATLKLPDSIIEDTTKHVTAAATVPADDRPQTVTTVYDAETGESRIYVKEEPLPWLARDTHGELGMYVGIKNGERTTRLQVRQGLIQVKAMHVGAIASIDQPISGPIKADYFVGVGVWYRW